MTDEELKALVDAFQRKISFDPEIRSLSKKIADGEADFSDTSKLLWRRSQMLGKYLRGIVPDLAPGDRERLCTALLQNGYNDTNEIMKAVQEALDEALGVHLNPVQPKFPAERVQQVAHALEDPTVKPEVIQRRANAPVANVNMSFHDDYIKENAKIRAKLGFKCYLNRVAAAGCCKWCTDIAGRYVYGDEPEDVFHRHDNCGCTVTFENGRERQDVWSKRTWQASPLEVMRNGFQPARNSPAQAAKINENAQDGLTLAGERDIINSRRMFRKGDSDPMFEVTGRAIDSNPNELKEMMTQLQQWGVAINRGQNTLGYGCTRNGKPGCMSVTDDASYSAWCHEFDHAKKDMEAGWNGLYVLWCDPEERVRREESAYKIEIELARKAGREDIAKRLEANLNEEIRKIWDAQKGYYGDSE